MAKKRKECDPSKPPPIPRPNAHSLRCGCTYRANLNFCHCSMCSEDCRTDCNKRNRCIAHPSCWTITALRPEHKGHEMEPQLLRTSALTPAMKQMIEATAPLKSCGGSRGITELLEALHKVQLDSMLVKNYMQKVKTRTSCESLTTADAHRIDRELSLKNAADNNFAYFREVDKEHRLQRMFWQTPDQKLLYQQYHDVVVYDTTAGTNIFKLPLHLFVVVDSFFRTRLVGCALTTGETVEDFEWTLRSFCEAAGGTAPSVIITDKDPGIISACQTVLQDTRVVHCSWHAQKNLERHCRPSLQNKWDEFCRNFDKVCCSTFEGEFKDRWAELIQKYVPDHPKIEKYLNGLYDERYTWAWPWVRTVFTAGMKSTQRVEKTNHLVKKLNNNNSRASITSIVNTTLDKSERDYFQGIFNTHRDALKGPSRRQSTVEASSATSGMFKELLQAHEGLLDFFARDRMMEEMNYSLGYRCDSTSLASLHEVQCCFVLVFIFYNKDLTKFDETYLSFFFIQ